MIGELLTNGVIRAMENGYVPDALVRAGIRHLCSRRLRDPSLASEEARERLVEASRRGPIAPVPEKANEQHYELPPEFFAQMLGSRRKYSCCYFEDDSSDLTAAEEAALRRTCEHAELEDGMNVLELGCGWGSLSLWMAEQFPHCRVTAVSNSSPQRRFILAEAERRGFADRLEVITADMNDFASDRQFDRIVSVEMFEHMRNYERLLRRISRWLAPQGKLLVHIFCHRRLAYEFNTEGAANWMGRYFFTGGIMPSDDLLGRFADDLHVTRQWRWNGQHYQKTAEAWLANLDARRDAVLPILAAAYGPQEANRWLQRWRIFLLAVAELFGYEAGNQWYVSHYLLEPVHAGADVAASQQAALSR